MAVEPASASFDNYTPTQWLMYLSGLDFVALEEMRLSYDTLNPAPFSSLLNPTYFYEPLPMETHLGIQSTNVDEGAKICAVCSSSISPPSPPPSPQVVLFLPPKWYEIPQRLYEHGRKQWDHRPSEPILFQVEGSPGVNMGKALRKKFAGLEGRDDLVLRDAKKAISCRFLFPGYPGNKSPQIFTTYWNKDRDPISRSKLAHLIAKKLEQYLNSMRSSHILEAATDERWKIGEGFMHIDNMFLAKLEFVSKGSFQPQIWVTNPAM